MEMPLPLTWVERGPLVMKKWIGLVFVMVLLITVFLSCKNIPEFVTVDPTRHSLYNDPISDEEMMGIGP